MFKFRWVDCINEDFKIKEVTNWKSLSKKTTEWPWLTKGCQVNEKDSKQAAISYNSVTILNQDVSLFQKYIIG